MGGPFGDSPALVVTASDGAALAVFTVGGSASGPASGPASASGSAPLLLVHGTGSDHTTWRVLGPLLAATNPVYAMDRRGRGASGDGQAYDAGLEVADLALATEAVEARHGRPVVIVGHSLGGRLGLAAALRTSAIGGVVAYEGAPVVRPPDQAGSGAAVLADLEKALAAGDHDAVLEQFMREIAGLPETELAAFRASSLWPVRAATAPQIVRELRAARTDPAIGFERLAAVAVPVLQVMGAASAAPFRDGVTRLHARLAAGRLLALPGARHNGHHTHATALAEAVAGFAETVD